jgi:hypothetical protein
VIPFSRTDLLKQRGSLKSELWESGRDSYRTLLQIKQKIVDQKATKSQIKHKFSFYPLLSIDSLSKFSRLKSMKPTLFPRGNFWLQLKMLLIWKLLAKIFFFFHILPVNHIISLCFVSLPFSAFVLLSKGKKILKVHWNNLHIFCVSFSNEIKYLCYVLIHFSTLQGWVFLDFFCGLVWSETRLDLHSLFWALG